MSGLKTFTQNRRGEANFGGVELISIGYFEATRGYVIYSPRRVAPR